MMKYFKPLPILFVIFGSSFSTAHATTGKVSNDSAHDMLRGSADGNTEDENSDSISKWGSNGKRGDDIVIAKPLEAIDESSFAAETNRAPASGSARGPATVKPMAVKKPLPAPKTMVRTLKQKKAYQEAAVIVNDLGFFPSTLFVTQGVPVRLFVTGASQRSQCIILDAFGVRRQIRNQKVEEVTFTPDQAGKFAFSCPMNGAKGTIIVKELEVQRLPASEPVETTSVSGDSPSKSNKDDSDDINDDDFGIEFK